MHTRVISLIMMSYYIPPLFTVQFPMTLSMRYQPIFYTLYLTLHCACVLNNVVITTFIEMVEIVVKELVNVQLNE